MLAMYSQAWGGNRTNTVTCSDLSETLTINECLYDGQTPDGLLIECTYIADGTTADFTFSANSWHLHAFSNRHAWRVHPRRGIQRRNVLMIHTVKKFNDACRRLEREGFEQAFETWADIDESVYEVARALHPDGSYALYKRPRSPKAIELEERV